MNITIIETVNQIRQLRDIDLLKDINVNITEKEFINIGDKRLFHSFDLNNIVIQGKSKPFGILINEMKCMNLKNVQNKTILDVGAWDGFFSLEAVRRGAYVTSLDYYSWLMDFENLPTSPNILNQYDYCKEHPDFSLPGQKYIRKAVELLHVEDRMKLVCSLFRDYKSDPFDIVFYLGVLYHTKSPLEELEHLRSLTKEYAIIETLYKKDTEILFFGKGEVNNDLTTLWAMNEVGLTKLLKRAGFSNIVINAITPPHQYAGNYPPLSRVWLYAYV